jgi:hypothetical protein
MLVTLLAPFLFPAASYAATVEVSPGDDIVSLTASLAPGSEVVFAPGTYTIDRTLEWTGAGTASAPIRLRGSGGVIIEATAGNPIARVRGASGVVVEGITFRGAPSYLEAGDHFTGLIVEDASDVTLRDVVVRDVGGTGVALYGDNAGITLEHVEVTATRDGTGLYVGCWDASCWTRDSVLQGLWIHDLGGDGAIGVHLDAGTQGVTLRDAVIHGVVNRGIQVESTEYGPANVIERNAVFLTGDGIGVHGAAIVRNNVVFDTTDEGLRSHPMDGRVLEGVVISHNTVLRSASWALEIDDWNGTEGMVVANNVFANPTGYGARATDAELEGAGWFSHNVVTGLVDGLADRVDAVIPGAGFADFVDAAAGDLYPRRSGGLPNAGDADPSSQSPGDDFQGFERDVGSPDVGAFEWVSDENPGSPVGPGFKAEPGPIPAADGVGGCRGDRAGIWPALVLLAARRRRHGR